MIMVYVYIDICIYVILIYTRWKYRIFELLKYLHDLNLSKLYILANKKCITLSKLAKI